MYVCTKPLLYRGFIRLLRALQGSLSVETLWSSPITVGKIEPKYGYLFVYKAPSLYGLHESSKDFARPLLCRRFVKHPHIYRKKVKCALVCMYVCMPLPSTGFAKPPICRGSMKLLGALQSTPISVGKNEMSICIYVCVYAPSLSGLCKALSLQGFAKPLGVLYTHTYTHFSLSATDT